MPLNNHSRIRAVAIAGLAALVLATSVFVDADRVRVKVVDTSPVAATNGVARIEAAGSQIDDLRPPFALIARINNQSPVTGSFSIAADGVMVCERSVAGGTPGRVDCAVGAGWNATAHDVTIKGPSSPWTLEFLELATHHGHTTGFHSLLVLPASSIRFTRPSPAWIAGFFLALTALLALVPHATLGRRSRVVYRVVAGLIVLELVLSVLSPWVSDYRIVLSAHTFAIWVLVLLAPRLGQALSGVPGENATFVRRAAALAAAAALAGFGVVPLLPEARTEESPASRTEESPERAAHTRRQALRDELQPVTLKNCTLRRFGNPNDGGYLMCENLFGDAASAYSYGIDGEDSWGCDVSKRIEVPVHQYDCFNTTEPACPTNRFRFHPECIGGSTATIESRLFDTLANQIAKNGDAGKRLIVKMDVEGAEWESLLAASDSVLENIEQMPMELHGPDLPRALDLVRKLKRTFHMVHIHFNNQACSPAAAPFPAVAFQVLFVNKRLGVVDPSAPPPTLPRPEDARDAPSFPDCQELAADLTK